MEMRRAGWKGRGGGGLAAAREGRELKQSLTSPKWQVPCIGKQAGEVAVKMTITSVYFWDKWKWEGRWGWGGARKIEGRSPFKHVHCSPSSFDKTLSDWNFKPVKPAFRIRSINNYGKPGTWPHYHQLQHFCAKRTQTLEKVHKI